MKLDKELSFTTVESSTGYRCPTKYDEWANFMAKGDFLKTIKVGVPWLQERKFKHVNNLFGTLGITG